MASRIGNYTKYCAEDSEITYFVVRIKRGDEFRGGYQLVKLVPETWLDETKQYVLYPPKGSKDFNLDMEEWREKHFFMRRIAATTYVEHRVKGLYTTAGTY